MSTDFQKDELQVEHYDSALVEEKRRKILKRVGIGIGVATVLAVLGYFGLNSQSNTGNGNGWEGEVVGGAGAWYESEVEYQED